MTAQYESPGSGGRGGTYLLTWTTYGTWLPGDARGFVGRVPGAKDVRIVHNVPGEPFDADDPRLRREALGQVKGHPVRLSPEQVQVCAEAFREVCDKYRLSLHAGAIMATHVHLVVTSEGAEGARLLNLFKGVSSRRLGQDFGRQPSGWWWTTGGSRRVLPDGRAIGDAVNYVRNQEHVLATIEHERLSPPSPGARDPNVNPEE